MKTFNKKISNVEIVIASVFLLTTVFIIFISALMRTIGTPINGSWDLALLLFSWSAFLGADIAFREDKLVNVDVLTTRMPKGMQKTVELIMYIMMFIFLVALVYLGSKLSVTTWHRSFQGIPGLSYTWVTLSIPVTALSMIITMVIKIYKKFVLREQKVIEGSTSL